MAPKTAALSVERAWNTVALEERLELIARSNALGISAAFGFISLVGSIAYGFDAIWMLWASIIGGLIVSPLFASYEWRRGKPDLILKYLAARSVARRYGYGSSIPELDIVIIFRGMMREVFQSEEEESLRFQSVDIDFEQSINGDKEVWICLMQGGVVVISERSGGAKLEFSSVIAQELTCKRAAPGPDVPDRALEITGTGFSKGKCVLLWSASIGALYVFEKKLQALVYEGVQARQRLLEAAAVKPKR